MEGSDTTTGHVVAGWAGITLGALLVVGFILDMTLMATTGGPPMIQLSTLHADVLRLHGNAIWPVETWAYALQIVPAGVFTIGLGLSLRSSGQSQMGAVACICFILFQVVHALHNLLLLGVISLLSSYVPGSPEATAIETVVRGILGVAYAAFEPGVGVGTPLLVFGLLAFGIAQRRLSYRWTHRLAFIAAALLAAGALQVVAQPALFMALIGWVIGIAWIITTSVGLLGAPTTARSVLAAQPA